MLALGAEGLRGLRPNRLRPERRGDEAAHHQRQDEGRDTNDANPEVLQPHLEWSAKGKTDSMRLFSMPNRGYVLRAVHRICKLAGVPIVPAHGLRGTHARLAVAAGLSGELVAASFGHESFA